MLTVLPILLYIVASIFFILGIKQMGKTQTAKQGNLYSALGMLLALVAVFLEAEIWDSVKSAGSFLKSGLFVAIIAIVVGSLIGAVCSKRVKLIQMPELVALFNGFGGLSSLMVAVAEFLRNYPSRLAQSASFNG